MTGAENPQPYDFPAEDGPSSYNLTVEERQRIFTEQILPQRLQGGVPQTHPVVVYLIAQPGAGKTTSAQTVTEALSRRGGAIRFCSDFFKPYHPEYNRLLVEHPRIAGALIREDYKTWRAMGEDYARQHRVDCVVEIAPGSVEQFTRSAQKFKDTGYGVEVIAMAVPEAFSRLGTALRYIDQITTNDGVGRFPPPEGHDRCYRAVADIASAIDSEALVDFAIVAKRGLEVVYANHRADDGTWANRATTREALDGERNRPWSPTESLRFDAGIRRLNLVLGTPWRQEIDDIVARAQGLVRPLPATDHAGVAALPFTRPSSFQPRSAPMSTSTPPPRPGRVPGSELGG